ncbi:MAG: superoxide reductase [Kiritimatiellae bacterium]|nr:superoxide reductase [Kiritimatiellia bacterium]
MGKGSDEGMELGGQVNGAKDPGSLTELEATHVPAIRAPARVAAGEPFEVVVTVGCGRLHPTEKGHFIQFIELYVGDVFLTSMYFVPERLVPVLKATLTLDAANGPLRAFIHCNLHGVWRAEKHVRVE